ncbi:MAG TPA: SGNH/GDSL hydrolase family protein [Stellaceae bacterium]|nr:SGNH/GDSL hydrolase family protein [Stellaceae bacterium]
MRRHSLIRLLRRAAKILAINLLVLLGLLIPVELAFGDWLSGRTISMLNVRPNTLDVQQSPLYPPGTTITYRRDAYGFRGGTGDPADITILAVGGSTTNERWVGERDMWTARLQTLLMQRGCPQTIANAGIDGYSTVAHIASFRGWFDRVPNLKPRVILVYVGINDAGVDPGEVNNADSQRYTSPLRRLEHYVAARSAVRRLYVTLRGWWRARRAHLLHGETPVLRHPVWEPAALPADFETGIAGKLQAYRSRLERLDGLIRRFGSRPIYITQQRVDGRLVDGRWQQVVGSDGARDTATVAAIDRTTLSFCRDSGETCIDLAGELSFAPADHYDGVHTTPSGSARIAEFLAGKLAPLLCRNGAVR